MKARHDVMRTLRWFPLASALFLAFAACADDENSNSFDDADASTPGSTDASSDAANDANDGSTSPDASFARCDGEFCLLDLPNAANYGMTRWVFAGVYTDATIGAWAVANGNGLDDGSTSQLLHLDGDVWKVVQAVELDDATSTRSTRLTSLAGNGAGKLIAVGATREEFDTTGVVLRGDGATFTVEGFENDLRAVWWASANEPWIVGGAGRIFRGSGDTWQAETVTMADYSSIWGTSSDDVWVGGSYFDEEWGDNFGYLAHRTNGGGASDWTYSTFRYEFAPLGTREIAAGIATSVEDAWWAADRVLARTKAGPDAGEDDVVIDGWRRALRPPVLLRSFWAKAEDDIWAVGDLGRVYHFDGTNWTDARLVFNGAPLMANLTAISGTSTGELLIVGDGVALRRRAP